MQRHFAKALLPVMMAMLIAIPAVAQVRLGLDIGPLSVRIAPDRPPPIRVEVRPERPDRSHVWIGGYWDRRGDQWDWAPGRWERPSQRGSSWIKPRYRRERDAWRYDPGHWSHQRVVEGEEYRKWNQGRGHGRGRGRENDRDHERGHEREREHENS